MCRYRLQYPVRLVFVERFEAVLSWSRKIKTAGKDERRLEIRHTVNVDKCYSMSNVKRVFKWSEIETARKSREVVCRV